MHPAAPKQCSSSTKAILDRDKFATPPYHFANFFHPFPCQFSSFSALYIKKKKQKSENRHAVFSVATGLYQWRPFVHDGNTTAHQTMPARRRRGSWRALSDIRPAHARRVPALHLSPTSLESLRDTYHLIGQLYKES